MTISSPSVSEFTTAAGEKLPQVIVDFTNQGILRISSQRPSDLGLTYTIGPMAIRSEGGKRTQYVLLNARGRGEVEVVHDADARLHAALADGQLELPVGATFKWVGRYEQKLKADADLRSIIAVSVPVMFLLIYIGTRSWLITAIIIICNASVTTAGGFYFVWHWTQSSPRR